MLLLLTSHSVKLGYSLRNESIKQMKYSRSTISETTKLGAYTLLPRLFEEGRYWKEGGCIHLKKSCW